jgi:hypothetical protein
MSSINGSGIQRWDLLQAAEKQLGIQLPLQQVAVLLELSELPEKGSYSQAEAKPFLETCRQFAALGGDLEALKAARAAAAVAESLEEAAAKKFETLAVDLSLAAAMRDRQIAEMMPEMLEQQLNELLATPGLLEEIFREGARHILAYEKAGYSESSQYQAWMDGQDKILRKIYRQLKLKQGWCYPQKR